MRYSIIYFNLTILFYIYGCGSLTETDQASTASCQSLLEDESWDLAIACFEDGDYLEIPTEDLAPDEHVYLTQWAGAYAGKYGLTGNAIIESIFETDGGGGAFDFATLAAELSLAGTLGTAINDMQKSVTLIQNIPEKYRNPDSEEAVYFAKDITTIGGLYSLFLFELQKRDFDDSLTAGELSEAEIIAKADAVLETLENGGNIVSDPELQAQIDSQFEALQQQPGDTTAEKLEALISSENGG